MRIGFIIEPGDQIDDVLRTIQGLAAQYRVVEFFNFNGVVIDVARANGDPFKMYRQWRDTADHYLRVEKAIDVDSAHTAGRHSFDPKPDSAAAQQRDTG